MVKWIKQWFFGRDKAIKSEPQKEQKGSFDTLSVEDAQMTTQAVRRTVEEYGEALKKMGDD